MASKKRLRAWHKGNPQSMRLETVPGVGLSGATAGCALVPDPKPGQERPPFRHRLPDSYGRNRMIGEPGRVTHAVHPGLMIPDFRHCMISGVQASNTPSL